MTISTPTIAITPGALSLDHLRDVYRGRPTLILASYAYARMQESRAIVDRIAAGDDAVYGINTGFGKLAGELCSAIIRVASN